MVVRVVLVVWQWLNSTFVQQLHDCMCLVTRARHGCGSGAGGVTMTKQYICAAVTWLYVSCSKTETWLWEWCRWCDIDATVVKQLCNKSETWLSEWCWWCDIDVTLVQQLCNKSETWLSEWCWWCDIDVTVVQQLCNKIVAWLQDQCESGVTLLNSIGVFYLVSRKVQVIYQCGLSVRFWSVQLVKLWVCLCVIMTFSTAMGMRVIRRCG